MSRGILIILGVFAGVLAVLYLLYSPTLGETPLAIRVEVVPLLSFVRLTVKLIPAGRIVHKWFTAFGAYLV